MDSQRQIDLHIHTTASDGKLKLDEIIDLCSGKRKNNHGVKLSAIAITDHDVVHPQLETRATVKSDLEIISGSEIKTEFENVRIEILGYFVDPANQKLRNMLQATEGKRIERMKTMIKRFNDLDVKVEGERVQIDPEQFVQEREEITIGRPHLGRELVARGVVNNLQQAFEQYLGNEQPCYQPVPRPNCKQVIETIHQARGLAFLAHPCFYSWDQPQFERQLRAMSRIGLDGVEVFYPYGSIKKEKQIYLEPKRVRETVTETELLTSGGSDFHSFEDSQLATPYVDYGILQAMKDKLELGERR